MNYRSKILNRIQVDLSKDSTKPMVYSSLILLFVFVMVFLFFIPSIDIVNKLRLKNTTLRERKDYLENLYVVYKEAANNYDLIKDRAYVFEKNIPLNPDPYYFVRQINNFSIENNIVLRNIKLLQKSDGVEGYEVFLQGNYTDIENFFIDLKKDQRYFSTEILSLNPSDTGYKSYSSLKLTAKIYIYYK